MKFIEALQAYGHWHEQRQGGQPGHGTDKLSRQELACLREELECLRQENRRLQRMRAQAL